MWRIEAALQYQLGTGWDKLLTEEKHRARHRVRGALTGWQNALVTEAVRESHGAEAMIADSR